MTSGIFGSRSICRPVDAVIGRAASVALALMLAACQSVNEAAAVAIVPDEARAETTVVVAGAPAVTWCHGADLAFPHWLVHGPSGRPLLDPEPEPYPHHRALWIA